MCMMMMGMLGAGVQAMGALAQGNAKAEADKRQAQQYEMNAQLDQRQAAADQIASQAKQRRMVEKGDALAGQQITATGAGGLALSGSPTDVILDSRRESALDVATVKYNADLASDNQMFKAKMGLYNADQANQAASVDRSNAILGAISPLIGGVTKMLGGGGANGNSFGGPDMFGSFGGGGTSLGMGF